MSAAPYPEQPQQPYGPPPEWVGDWSALAPEAQTAIWQQYSIRESLALQREQAGRQRATSSTWSVVFWVLCAFVFAGIVIAFAAAFSR